MNALLLFDPLGISNGDWFVGSSAVAVAVILYVLGRRDTWHSSVDQELKNNNEEHGEFHKRFQRLKDKHGYDTAPDD